VDRPVDRVGDRRHRRYDVDFANPLGAVRMGQVRHLDQDRFDHRHVGSNRHPVVEEPRIVEPALRVIDVFFVQGPADALCHAALELPVDIRGEDAPLEVYRSTRPSAGPETKTGWPSTVPSARARSPF